LNETNTEANEIIFFDLQGKLENKGLLENRDLNGCITKTLHPVKSLFRKFCFSLRKGEFPCGMNSKLTPMGHSPKKS
jgi:hypothetical protein